MPLLLRFRALIKSAIKFNCVSFNCSLFIFIFSTVKPCLYLSFYSLCSSSTLRYFLDMKEGRVVRPRGSTVSGFLTSWLLISSSRILGSYTSGHPHHISHEKSSSTHNSNLHFFGFTVHKTENTQISISIVSE